MGDIADMMIEGALCESCGEYLGDEVGFPRQCHSCANESRHSGQTMRPDGFGTYQNITPVGHSNIVPPDDGYVIDPNGNRLHRPGKTNCPECGKIVKRAGVRDHMRIVHQMAAKTVCPECSRRVSIEGLDNHLRDAHGITA